MRFMLNGQVTLGTASFWRVDDTEQMVKPDYNPIVFLQQPFALINATLNTADQARELVAKWNREAGIVDAALTVLEDTAGVVGLDDDV